MLTIAAWLTGFVYAVPTTPMPNMCAEYDGMTETLLNIESKWDEVVCKRQSQYIFLFTGYRHQLFTYLYIQFTWIITRIDDHVQGIPRVNKLVATFRIA